MKLPTVGNRNIDANFTTISKEIETLKRAVNARQEGSSQGIPLKDGDIRFIKGTDGSGYLEVGGKDGTYTTFQGGLQLKGTDIPYAYLHKLFVDNFYAKNIFAQSVRTSNGNLILSDSGVVASATGSTSFVVKNPDGTTLNPFVVGDLLYTAKFSSDHTTTIKELRLDVTAVSGLTVTYTKSSESGTNIPTQIGSLAAGDVLVRIGNNNLATYPERGNVILMATSDKRNMGSGVKNFAPYIKMLNLVSTYAAFFNGVPIVMLGRLGSIVDVDYPSLADSTEIGVYTSNAYLKGKLQIGSRSDIIGADWIISSRQATAPTSPLHGDLWYDTDDKKLYRWDANIGTPAWIDISERQAETFYSATAPTSPLPGDLWFDTTVTINQLKRWNGSSWNGVGANGTYIDSTGVYTSTIAADQIIAGAGIINSLSVLSTLTMGSAITDGYIQSYGWDGTVNGFQIKGGATPSVSLIGGSITSGTIRTAPSGARVELAGGGYYAEFFNGFGASGGVIQANRTGILDHLKFITPYAEFTGGGVFPQNIELSGGFTVATNKMDVSSLGQITRIDSKDAASRTGQALISDGTSFTPTVIPSSMVYPGAGIALSTGSAWGTSITDNSTAWNSAAQWVTDYGVGSRANWDAAYNDKINSASFNTGDGIITLTQQDAGTVTVDIDGRYLTAAITSLGGLTAATQTFAVGTSGTAPAFSSATSTHTLNIPMAATTSVTAGLISKTEYDTFNGKATATFGTTDAGTIYVASSSGGSPTTLLSYVPVTINGTTHNLLIHP